MEKIGSWNEPFPINPLQQRSNRSVFGHSERQIAPNVF